MRRGTQAEEAKRVTDRSLFGLECLLLVERATEMQMQRLLYPERQTSTRIDAMRTVRRRLVALKLVEVEYLDTARRTVLLKLSARGFFESFMRLSPTGALPPPRRRIAPETVRHQLELAELFVSLVTGGAKRWQDVRDCTTSFQWSSFDADVRIPRREEDVDGRVHERATVADAIMTTGTHRFLVEVERSTKTLDRVVREKARPYNAIFSTASIRGNRTPYQQKFPDALAPVVVFVVASRERATNLRKLLEAELRAPSWFVGDREEVVVFLRKHIGQPTANAQRERSEPDYFRLARESIDHSVVTRKLLLPAHLDLLRALTAVVYSPAEAGDRLRALDFMKRALG